MNRATTFITSLGLATGLLVACASPTPNPCSYQHADARTHADRYPNALPHTHTPAAE